MATAFEMIGADDAGVAVARKKTTPKRVSSESRRHGVLVRLGGELVEKAKEVAALRRMSMAEYLTTRFMPIVQADLDAEIMKRIPKK